MRIGRLPVCARRRPLIQVEGDQRPAVEKAGGGNARRHRQHQDRKGQQIQPAPAKKKRIRSLVRNMRELVATGFDLYVSPPASIMQVQLIACAAALADTVVLDHDRSAGAELRQGRDYSGCRCVP